MVSRTGLGNNELRVPYFIGSKRWGMRSSTFRTFREWVANPPAILTREFSLSFSLVVRAATCLHSFRVRDQKPTYNPSTLSQSCYTQPLLMALYIRRNISVLYFVVNTRMNCIIAAKYT